MSVNSVKGFRLTDGSTAKYDYAYLENIITDKELTEENVAADGKAVGDAVDGVENEIAELEQEITDVKQDLNALEDVVFDVQTPTMTSGGYIGTSNGNLTELNGYSYSEYIALDLVTDVYTCSYTNAGICYFNEDYVYLSGFDGGEGSSGAWYHLDPPANAKYMRFSNHSGVMSDADVKIANHVDSSIKWVDKKLTHNINNVVSTTEETLVAYDENGFPISKNYVFGTLDSSGAIIDYGGNRRVASVDYYTAKEKDILFIESGIGAILCEYDASKTLLTRNVVSGGNYYLTQGNLYRVCLWIEGSPSPSLSSTDELIFSATIESKVYKRMDYIESKMTYDVIPMYDNVICIGDSLTASQVYISSNSTRIAYKKYPDILGDLCGVNAYTYATPGDTAILWWERSSAGAFDNHGLYIVFLGTNGGFTNTISTDCVGTDPDNFANTQTGQYGRILQTIANNGDKAVLILPWGGGGSSLAITQSVIRQFGTRYSFPVISVDAPERTDPYYHYFPDKSGMNTLHFSDLGYAWLAAEVKRQINLLPTSEQWNIIRTQ